MTKLVMLAVALLAGCGFKVGLVHQPPAPTTPGEAASVTVYRPESLIGFPVPMVFWIDRVETYGLWGGQSYSFRLDPGAYVFGYYLGFNECSRLMRFASATNYLVTLNPWCSIRTERR